jgi:hypothetical protein
MLDLLIEFVFELFTLKGFKRGPLVVSVDVRDPDVHLTLENTGRRKIAFAAVRCQDRDGKQHFPGADLAAGTVLHKGQPLPLRLAVEELRSLKAQRLQILDTTGHAWPVEGFDGSALGAG